MMEAYNYKFNEKYTIDEFYKVGRVNAYNDKDIADYYIRVGKNCLDIKLDEKDEADLFPYIFGEKEIK